MAYTPLYNTITAISVGSGKNFSTIQAAYDSLKGKVPSSAVVISVDPGTYNEALVFDRQPYADYITIQGDTRTSAGKQFTTTGNIVNVSGTTFRVTLTITPPNDFTSSDYAILAGTTTAANTGKFAIVSINTTNKTVDFTIPSGGTAEAVLSETRLIFVPNRIINAGSSTNNNAISSYAAAPISIKGFDLTNCKLGVYAVSGGKVQPGQITVYGAQRGFISNSGGWMYSLDGYCSAVSCSLYGFISQGGSWMRMGSSYAANSTYGYHAAAGSYLFATSSIATKNPTGYFISRNSYAELDSSIASFSTTGFSASTGGVISIISGAAKNNTTGYSASYLGYIDATSTHANNNGNSAEYSPGTSDAFGNGNGQISWS